MFQVMLDLGHKIMTLDEEALVHLPPETYFSRRVSPMAIKYVSHLFAWGPDNAQLWREYPHLPEDIQIHITGNPRGDLLRPEMRPFYEKEAAELRNTFGEFILVNTNFNHVNAFYPKMNLFQPVSGPGENPRFGRAAKGMTREYAEGFRNHKQAIFETFKQLVPALDQAFPDYTIVVRPHPIENQEIYHTIAARCERVRVTNEGNIVPWLMSTRALIHNGCTTGVEAYVLRVPTISYRATVDDYYDLGFYRLPNLLSYQCFDLEELQSTLGKILADELGTAGGEERKELIDHYLAAQDGPLACERMVDVLEEMLDGRSKLPKPDWRHRLVGFYRAKRLGLKRHYKLYFSRSHITPQFQRHRYPEISLEQVRARVLRFQQILGDTSELKLEQIANQIYHISA
jgi:surface carbohydrate biosynthesis protein